METKLFCQSCTMPLDSDAVKGTEKNGSKSSEYCMYCYENGVLKNPDMTLDQMEDIIKTQMQKMNLPENLVNMSLNMLPTLKRWKKI
ncbi:MAG: zinc ribbon domain-containing protein [Bacteroidetes bacterium]|nr:zinc ribbon domain-containing protein [Bacteroidota bacterium]